VAQALDILHAEAAAGLLDADLVQVLIESRVYEHLQEQDWHSL
jgi:hypothetical protein